MYVCVSVSIMAKGLWGKRIVHEGNAGGKSTLRRFHYQYFREHDKSILCLKLTHSDDVIVTGSQDKTFKVISLSTSEVLHSKKEHNDSVTALCLNKCDSLLATGESKLNIKCKAQNAKCILQILY